jgi:hypothetical protein
MVILIALFLEPDSYKTALRTIRNKFKIQNNRVFVLDQPEDDEEIILTFNIELDDETKQDLNLDEYGKLIRVHRKKETNTLYTINALNLITSKEKEMDWKKYKYCFLTVSTGMLKVIKTKLKEVVDLDKLDEPAQQIEKPQQ